MSQYATVSRQGEIAVVTLDNPPVNALSHHLREALMGHLTTLREDAGVKGIVIACAGRTFVSGADDGAITVHGTLSPRAHHATPWAMFPADAVTTPRSSRSGDRRAIALTAPRILNDPIGWRFSNLR